MELLAPSGSMDALIAAVQAGADAIYLGGKAFGARHYASNFSMDELKEAVEYCHLRDVSVYVTVNTLVHDRELADLEKYLQELELAGVDGIIVQDFGVVQIAKKVAPQLELHASTQMTIHNLEAALAFEKMGFTRIVLARELSLAEIESICQGTSLEIEIFVHGALCVSYSGQCLMSSVIGGRSGNRGKCAQPCRLPYQLLKDNKVVSLIDGEHLLSPKDLNFLEYLPAFEKIGVKSLKIEGRMKSPEYVATVVHSYKEAMKDIRSKPKSKGNLEKVFHRGYSAGYLTKVTGKAMMATQRPNNLGEKIGKVTKEKGKSVVIYDIFPALGDKIEIHYGNSTKTEVIDVSTETIKTNGYVVSSAIPSESTVYRVYDKNHMSWASAFYKESKRQYHSRPIQMTLKGEMGSVLQLTIQDQKGNFVEVMGEQPIEKPLKKALDYDLIRKQMEKLGGTPFHLEQLNLDLPESFFLPLSELNQIRRNGLDILIQKLLRRDSITVQPMQEEEAFGLQQQPSFKESQIYVAVKTVDQARVALAEGADVLGIEGDFKSNLQNALAIAKYARSAKKESILLFPRIIPEEEVAIYHRVIEDSFISNFDGVELSSFAFLEKIRSLHPTLKIIGGFSLNILNEESAKFYLRDYFDEVTLSPELTIKEIAHISQLWGERLQIQVYGNQEVMISKFCAIGAYMGSLDRGACLGPCNWGKPFYLKDRKNEVFPLVTDEHCRMHILNGKALSLLPYMQKIHTLKVKTLRLDGRLFHDFSLMANVVRAFKKSIKEKTSFSKEDEKYLLGSNITRGHYFRGVE